MVRSARLAVLLRQLRYHRADQLVWRVVRRVQDRADRLRADPPEAGVELGELTPEAAVALRRMAVRREGLWPRKFSSERLERMTAGTFSFLNQQADVRRSDAGEPLAIDWTAGPTRLWRFHLQSHEYLLELAGAGHVQSAWRIVEQWMAAPENARPGGASDAWHPFCISRRLPVWLMMLAAYPPEGRPSVGSAGEGIDTARRGEGDARGVDLGQVDPRGDLAERVGRSIARQTARLARRVEWDLRGNHLLENLRALVMVECAFRTVGGGERTTEDTEGHGGSTGGWLDWAVRRFLEQLDEQLLESGEHFERSPMYHALMLLAVLETTEMLEAVGSDAAPAARRAVRRMAEFLEGILHPDGDIPLFADAALDETPDARRLCRDALGGGDVAAAGPESKGHWQASGTPEGQAGGDADDDGGSRGNEADSGAACVGDYWRWAGPGGDWLLVDGGDLACDYLPAHAHADLLSVEASLGGRRLLVDGGTFDYDRGEMRFYCRGTAAHNTAMLGDVDHCELGVPFRVGRRGHVRSVASGRAGSVDWFTASHDAYRHLGVKRVWRFVAAAPGPRWVILDGVTAHVAGRPLTSRLRFHPEAQVERRDEREFAVTLGERRVHVRLASRGEVQVETGWYCPEFGVREAMTVLVARAAAPGQRVVAWRIDGQ